MLGYIPAFVSGLATRPQRAQGWWAVVEPLSLTQTRPAAGKASPNLTLLPKEGRLQAGVVSTTYYLPQAGVVSTTIHPLQVSKTTILKKNKTLTNINISTTDQKQSKRKRYKIAQENTFNPEKGRLRQKKHI